MSLRLASAHVGDVQVTGGGNGISLERFRGLGSPIPRAVRFSRARRHGSIDRTQYFDGRMFGLAGHVKGLSEADAWERLDDLKEQVALVDDGPVLLRWLRAGRSEEEQAEVKVEGELEAELVVDSPTVLRWALTLFAPDPRIYSATLKTAAYDPTTAGTGFGLDLPLAFPLTFPGEGATTHLQVENQGRFPTPPVLTVTGPALNPILENDTTGARITTQGLDLGSDQQLEVDVDRRRVLLIDGGESERPDLIDAEATTWWELVKGVNLLRLNGQDMVGGQTELAVEFRDATT